MTSKTTGTAAKKSTAKVSRCKVKTDPSPYPKGWIRKRAEALIEFYENQSDDDAIAEAETAYHAVTTTMMQAPVGLVAKVQKLIAKSGS